MKQYLRIIILLVGVIVCNESNATHNAGCDIQYSYRSKDSIDLTLSIYKDCKGPSLGAMIVRIIGIGCSYSAADTIQPSYCSDVTPICKKSCSKCDRNNCNTYGYPNGANAGCNFAYGVEKIIYFKTINLTNTNCCKLRIEVSSCCRSGAITTCCAGENLYSYAEIDRCNAAQNTSPIFNNNPSQIMCVDGCMGIDFGGTDTTDNDSISYNLSPALTAYGSPCTYQGAYTFKSPLYYDGFPNSTKFNSTNCKGFSFDSTTGIMNFKPMQQQIAVVAIDIKEWRKDTANKMVQIGLTRRDFQIIIVANCSNKPPSLQTINKTGCAGNLICLSGVKSSDPNNKDTVRLTYSGKIPGAKFSAKFNGSAKQEFTLCWQTSDSDASSKPYYFTVTATDDACPINGIYAKIYSITLNHRLPNVTHKVTHIACGKVKLESPKSNAMSTEKFIYKWTVSGKQYIGKDTIVDYNYDSSNVIKLEVSISGCSVIYYDTLFNLPKPLKLDIGPDAIGCQRDNIIIKAKASSGFPPYKYQWQTGNARDSLDSCNFIFNASKIICKVTDSIGCENYDTLNLFTHPSPLLNLGLDKTLCGNDSIILDAGNNNGNIKSYIWNNLVNGNITDTVQKIAIYKSAYTSCTIVDSFGCQNTDTIAITMGPKVTVNTNHLYTQCPNDTVTFIATGPDSMVWANLNTGSIIHIGSSFKKSFAPNSYTEILLHSFKTDSGITCDKYDTVLIIAFPRTTVSLSRSNDTLYVSSSMPAKQYNWKRDNLFLTSTQLPYLYITQTGKYQVGIVDSNGCVDSSQSIIIAALYANVPYIYNSSEFKVYPNPSTGIYYIESTSTINVPIAIEITIYDLMGRRIINNSSNKNIIDLSTQPEGIYLLQINKNIWMRLSKL